MKRKLTLFALGGNEISPMDIINPVTGKLKIPDVSDQWNQTAKTCKMLASIIKKAPEDYFIVSHGNGPQVGNFLRRAELAKAELHLIPLDVVVAATQGSMGHMMTQLSNLLALEGVKKRTAAMITHAVVDRLDPAFQNPDKFIGSGLSKEEALRRQKEEGHDVKFYKIDSTGKEIWRRVVSSPKPQNILEADLIATILKMGVIPVAAGGGGIPVASVQRVLNNGMEYYEASHGTTYERSFDPEVEPAEVLTGIEAVVDKDLSTALLGVQVLQRMPEVQGELFIFTNIECAKLNFQCPDEADILEISVNEAQKLIDQGMFQGGSMKPKVQAAVNFVKGGGKKAVITRVDLYHEAQKGQKGTIIKP